ncbi:glycoside hydrolase family 2 TIM barrel-domain containing protein [Microbacterium helvum]|nr:glycoside hydrolase family 2 TIM barrel-domain containing protein [Microbacterium helvum]
MSIGHREEGRRLPARAGVATDTARLDLSGLWAFHYSVDGRSPEGALQPPFDDTLWDRIRVPSHWVLEGDGRYGRPQYTNVTLPIPLDPPHAPDLNPTGTYRRTFELADGWLDGTVVLRTEGIESEATIWVNGIELGTRNGSRLVQDFDATDAVHPGENVITIRVRQWSAGTYLEDQDQWWMPGIFREVVLLHRPAGSIDDVWLRCEYDHLDGSGTVVPEIAAHAAAWPVTLEIPALGVRMTWADRDSVSEIRIPAVQPWSAERPDLYDVQLVAAGETVSMRVGFRSIAIRDGVLQVNGRPIKIRGMNRHEIDAERGRVFDEEEARRDLILMKQHNVDGIRTAHYPPHPRLLDLADELGFWVVLECDLETSGFLDQEPHWRGNPADDPAWGPALLDRVMRTVERDKNHPSIIMWSIANESGMGSGLAAMSAWVKQRDPGRPVIYEGDYTADYTDVYCRMYPTLEEIDAFLADDGPIGVASHPASHVTPEQARRARSLPYLLVEYAHAMGTGPGGLDGYAARIMSDPRIAGSFLWEWKDHTLRATTADGTPFLAYGGDFGEEVHDGNFCADGLVAADGSPRAGLTAWAQLSAPVTARWTDAGILVESHRTFVDTSDLRLRWAVLSDGVEYAGAALEFAPVGPGGHVMIEPPAELGRALAVAAVGGETVVLVQVVLAHETTWAPAGHVVSGAAHLVRPRSRREPVTEPAGVESGEAGLRVGPAVFDEASGDLRGIGGIPIGSAAIDLWRAPTDNDLGRNPLDYEAEPPTPANVGEGSGIGGTSAADRWRRRGLHRLRRRIVVRERSDALLHNVDRWMPAGTSEGVDASFTWSAERGDAVCDLAVRPADPRLNGIWPRVAWRLELPAEEWDVEWYGYGPGESYPDLMAGVRLGLWRSGIDGLAPDVARPQESGHRSGVRWLRLAARSRPALRIEVLEGSPGFSLRRWSPLQTTGVAHPHELPLPTAAHLSIELGMHGVGTRACGPDVRPEFALRPRELRARLRFCVEE